ncbi:MAG TPA: hypothetical protein VFQ92_19005 [Blastocatellia bacterium]|nr:hypothetical protein [Blastocatellia bacterium]
MKIRFIPSAATFCSVAFLLSLSLSLDLVGPRLNERLATDASYASNRAKFAGKKVKPYDQPAEAEEFYRMKRSPDGVSPVPADRYIKAIERANRMPQYSTAAAIALPPLEKMERAGLRPAAFGTWTQLGPGNIGGRTRALLIDPSSPDIMYAAGVAGGVWKTTDAGQFWTALDDLLPNLAVCSMAFDPTDSDIIYAGTGEGFFNSDMVRGAGIFKTTNGGASWTHLESTKTSDFHYVNDIVVSPVNRLRVYAGTRTGVWRSTDGGESWERTLDPLGLGGITVQGGCLDLAIRTDQPTDYLFASCGTFARATIYRNRSAGEQTEPWTPVFTDTRLARTSLAIAPSNQNIIYALASSLEPGNFNRGLLAVFRSNSSGEPDSWDARVDNRSTTKLNTVLLSNPVIAFQSDCGQGGNSFLNQGWYDNVIAVDPLDPERVWVGGIDLFRSDDGGRNWGVASYWWVDTDDPHYVHADQHAITFHPQYNGVSNRVMFVANDGGVFRTNNARARTATGQSAPCNSANTGVNWTSLNNSYGVTQFYHGLPYPNGKTYFGGAQDNGTLRGTDDKGIGGWNEIQGGDGGYVAIDATNPTTIYAEFTRLSIRRSSDGGRNFVGATSGINESSANFLFINPFIMDPSIPQRLWTGGRSMWRTSDEAASWSQASAPLSADRSVSAIAVAPTNSNIVLAGTNGGFIHRTSNALTSSANTQWAGTQPRAGFVSWLTFDPSNENVAYATYTTFGGTHVWKSTDGGATWTGIDGAGETGLPDVPVHTIAVDPVNSQTLYIGTDVGVFVSLDGGASWARENTGFANVVTESLSVGSVGNMSTLFAFTHGRGVWRVSLGPAALRIKSASVIGKKLVVFGQGIQPGARLLLNGVEQPKIKHDKTSLETNLIAKKSGRQIQPGQAVELQLLNPDGSASQVFRYVRP